MVLYRWVDETGHSVFSAMSFLREQDSVFTCIPRDHVTLKAVRRTSGRLDYMSFEIEHGDVIITGRVPASLDWQWSAYGISYEDLAKVLDKARVLQARSYDRELA